MTRSSRPPPRNVVDLKDYIHEVDKRVETNRTDFKNFARTTDGAIGKLTEAVTSLVAAVTGFTAQVRLGKYLIGLFFASLLASWNWNRDTTRENAEKVRRLEARIILLEQRPDDLLLGDKLNFLRDVADEYEKRLERLEHRR